MTTFLARDVVGFTFGNRPQSIRGWRGASGGGGAMRAVQRTPARGGRSNCSLYASVRSSCAKKNKGERIAKGRQRCDFTAKGRPRGSSWMCAQPARSIAMSMRISIPTGPARHRAEGGLIRGRTQGAACSTRSHLGDYEPGGSAFKGSLTAGWRSTGHHTAHLARPRVRLV